jgi:RNA polymerase sigma-70 factor (ECF subfamily)
MSPRDAQYRDRLTELFRSLQSELVGTVFYLLGNREDALDAVQEAFLKCWRHRERLADVRNLRAWVFQVVINTAKDVRGSAWRRKANPLGDSWETLSASDPDPSEAAERAEQVQRVREAILNLRDEDKEVFLLRQNGGLTYEQIAETLGLPVGTVKTRMRLALVHLRSALRSDTGLTTPLGHQSSG